MSEPEFLICIVCDTPTYDFEYRNDELISALCATCANDDLTQFMTEDELEEM